MQMRAHVAIHHTHTHKHTYKYTHTHTHIHTHTHTHTHNHTHTITHTHTSTNQNAGSSSRTRSEDSARVAGAAAAADARERGVGAGDGGNDVLHVVAGVYFVDGVHVVEPSVVREEIDEGVAADEEEARIRKVAERHGNRFRMQACKAWHTRDSLP
jgi:hypothetical protein